MEIKNSKGEVIEVHLKEKWNVPVKRRPVPYIFGLLLFILSLASMVFIIIRFGGGPRMLLVIGFYCLLFVLINLRMIIKMFKPAEYVVKTKNDTLSIIRNGTEKFSITSQKTSKIVPYQYGGDYGGDIIGIIICEEIPKGLSLGKKYNARFVFVPQDEVLGLFKLLNDFYGEQRLSELTV